MVALNKFFTSVVLVAVCAASGVGAAPPRPVGLKHATHRARSTLNGSGMIETYHPASSLETFGAGIDIPSPEISDQSLKDAAVSFVSQRLSIDPSTVRHRAESAVDAVTHTFLSQQHEDIPFANAVANVAFKNNKVVSFGNSFVKPKSIASSKPSITVEDAIAAAEKKLGGKYNDHPATLEYFVKDDDSVVLTRVVQIQDDVAGSWYEAFVDAHSGDVVSVTDFVAHATYRVVPVQDNSLLDGFSNLVDPADLAASPNGWNNDGSTTTDTSGNNVIASHGSTTTTTKQSASGDVFVFNVDLSQQPSLQVNLDAASTNAFYLVNTVHDFTYRYGFTEANFNFQQDNFGKGGAGNDRVQVSVQNPSGLNNADFSTPPDGQPGRMRMFLWNHTNPERDGALENDIVVHENTHGVTNRLVGGGTARCLQTTEAGGMGEGWSDAMADLTEKTSANVPDFAPGNYVVNSAAGIRSHPYSTSSSVNPLTYADVGKLSEVHAIGEVWANILHNVYAALVGAHGWSSTVLTNPNGTEGNIVHLHLFIDSLQLMPCNPTFVSARDAWIQADANRYDGANKCTLWKAFASRGLGVNAANHRNDNTIPSDC